MKHSFPTAKKPGNRNMVGALIRAHREANWTKTQFASILRNNGLNVSRTTLLKIENGDRYLLDYELVAIAAALEVSVLKLIPDPPGAAFKRLEL